MLHEALKEQIIALELGRHKRRVLPLGLPVIDAALQGGLDMGAVHELTGPAAAFFAQVIIQRKGGTVLWLTTSNLNDEYYPSGLAQYGGCPEHFTMVCLQNTHDLLKAAYEVLASNAADCALLEMQKPLTPTQMRKLQFTAQNTDTLGLIIKPNYAGTTFPAQEGLLGSAPTRWHAMISRWTAETTQIELHLLKNRRGSPCHWIVEIDHATHHLHLAPLSGE